MDVGLLGITSLAVFLATVFQAVAGFGYAIVGVPILSPILGPKAAVIFLLISGTYMRGSMLYMLRKQVSFARIKNFFAGALIGVVPGGLVLKLVSVSTLNIILGATLILAVTLLSCHLRWETKHKTWEQIAFGVVGGFFTAATGVGGPPLALYMLNAQKDKQEARTDLIFYFVICNCWTLLSGLVIGNVAWQDFVGLPLWTLPAAFLGMWVGEKIFHRINQHLFNRIALLAILLSGLTMLSKGVNL